MKTQTKKHLLHHAQHPILRTLGETLLCCIAFLVGIGIYSLSNSFAQQSVATHNSAENPSAEDQIVASCPVTFATQTTKIYGSPSEKQFLNGTQWPSGKIHAQTSPTCDVLKSRCGAFGFEDNDCDSYCGRWENNTYIETQYVCGDLYLEKDVVIAGKTYFKGERYPYGVLLWGDCNDNDPSYKANRSTMTTCGQWGVWNCTNGFWTCKGGAGGTNGSTGGPQGNASIEGWVTTRDGASVNQVKINLYNSSFNVKNVMTNPDGKYNFPWLFAWETYIIWPEKRDGIHRDFVTTKDVVMVEQYLNGQRQLDEEEMLAADVNDDKKIDQTDINIMRDLILGRISHLPVQNIRKFTLKQSSANLLFNGSSRRRTLKGASTNNPIDFTAVKLGDVSWDGSNVDEDDWSSSLKWGNNNGGQQQLPPAETFPPEQEPIIDPIPAPIEEQPIEEPIDDSAPSMDVLPIEDAPIQEPIEDAQPGYTVPDLQLVEDTTATAPTYNYQPTQPAYQPITIPYVYTPAAFDRSAWFATPSAITITPSAKANSFDDSTTVTTPTNVYTAPASANGTIYYFGN